MQTRHNQRSSQTLLSGLSTIFAILIVDSTFPASIVGEVFSLLDCEERKLMATFVLVFDPVVNLPEEKFSFVGK